MPIGRMARGVFEQEVLPHEALGIVEERGLVVGTEMEIEELRVGAQPAERRVEARERGGNRALGRLEQEQPLEGRVDERALRGPRRRRLGEAVDGGEPERQRAVGEGGDLRRRQRAGRLQRHTPIVHEGYDSQRDTVPESMLRTMCGRECGVL